MNTFMRLIAVIFTALCLVLVSGCAHHRDVRAGADGVHTVITRATTKEEADRSAIGQAESFCKQSQQRPGFVEEKSKYTGSMDEETRETIRRASAAAVILGGTGVAVGNGGTRTGGTVLGSAGTVGSVMTNGDDYEATMRFKCQ